MSEPGRVLGAVLAGGRSSRFGSDKGEARIGGETMIARVLAALVPQCDAVCVIGRAYEGGTIPDRPSPLLGPLGGLAGAMHHARVRGFDTVLTSAVDIPDLPADLVERLSAGSAFIPAFVADQPVVGLWRVADLPILERLLASDTRRSMRAFCDACGARAVALGAPLSNLNTVDDLREFVNRVPPGRARP